MKGVLLVATLARSRLMVLCVLLGVSTDALAGSKSLFVDPYWMLVVCDEACVREALEHVCNVHRTSGSPYRIDSLAVASTADVYQYMQTGQLNLTTAGLNILKDYFHCFDNVFFGTIGTNFLQYEFQLFDDTPTGKAMRDNYIAVSSAVADKLKAWIAANTTLPWWFWYISPEQSLNWTGATGTKNGTKDLLGRLSDTLYAKHPAATFLWSPLFTQRYATLSSAERSAIRGNFHEIIEASPEYNWWVHFQDKLSISATNGFTCSDDIVPYYHLIRDDWWTTPTWIAVNMEYFTVDAQGNLVAGSLEEHSRREACYSSAGVGIGFSWEILWWRSSHGEPPPPCP